MALGKLLSQENIEENESARIAELDRFVESGVEVGEAVLGNSRKVFSEMPRINALRNIIGSGSNYNFSINLYHDPNTTNPKPNPIDLYKITPKMKEIYDRIQKLENRELRDTLIIRFFQLVEFDFRKVADYYTLEKDEEIKDLFESLALVIVDYENTIKHGFFDVLKSINDFGEVKCNNTVFAERTKEVAGGKIPYKRSSERKVLEKVAAETGKSVAEVSKDVDLDALLDSETPKKISYDLDI